jgi:hypothetical protein
MNRTVKSVTFIDIMEAINERADQHDRCIKARRGELEVTPELMASIKFTKWKVKLIEAICLGKVCGKDEASDEPQ